MADGASQKKKQPYAENPDLGPDEYDIDLSGLDHEESVETAAEGSEAESYVRELRHREEEVLKGELHAPYGVDEILHSASMQASGKMPPLPQQPQKPGTKVEGDYEKQIDETLGKVTESVESATMEARDVQNIVDDLTDEFGPAWSADRLYDHTIEAAGYMVPVVVDTPKDALQTLDLIEGSLEESKIESDEIDGLKKILEEIIKKHGSNAQIKAVADSLGLYLNAAAQAYSAKAEVPAYETEASHRSRVETAKRMDTAHQVASLLKAKDYDGAYALASKAAETDPDHFRFTAGTAAKLAGKYDEAEALLRTLSGKNEVDRQLSEIRKIRAYKKMIAETYQGGDLETAFHAAERAAKNFPDIFGPSYRKISKEFEELKEATPIPLVRKKTDKRRDEIEMRRSELAAEEKKREEEAKADEGRKAELDEERKKREEEKKRLEKEAEELEKEAKRLEIEELPLWETVVKVPLTNIDAVKEALQRVKEALRVRKLTEEEEIELHQFLQEVERRYPTTTELDADISDINRILKEVQEERDEEPPYRAFPEAPEVPVEYKRPKPKEAEKEATEEEQEEPEEPAVEPVKAETEEGETAEPSAPAEPPVTEAPAEPAQPEAESAAPETPRRSVLASVFAPRKGRRFGGEAIQPIQPEPEEKKEEKEEEAEKGPGVIASAFKAPTGIRLEAKSEEETEASEEKPAEEEAPKPGVIAQAFSPERTEKVAKVETETVPVAEEATEEKEEIKENLADELEPKPEAPKPVSPAGTGLFNEQLASQLQGVKISEKAPEPTATPAEAEEAEKSLDELYAALKDDEKFKQLLELVQLLKKNPDLAKDDPIANQLRTVPDMLPVENGHKYLLEQIINGTGTKAVETNRTAIGALLEGLHERGVRVTKEKEKKVEAAEEPVAEEAAEAEENAEEKTDENKELIDNLFEAVEKDPNYQELARIIQILRTSQRRLDDEAKESHLENLKRLFGTDKQQEIRDLINHGDDAVLKALMEKDRQVIRGGEIDHKAILGPIVEHLEGEKSVDAGKRACLSLLMRLQALQVAKPVEEKVEEKTEEQAPETVPSAQLQEAEEAATEAPKVEEAVTSSVRPEVMESWVVPSSLEAEEPSAAAEEPAVEAPKPVEKEEVKVTEDVPEPVAKAAPEDVERAEVPQALKDAINEAVKGDADKKKKLLDLWEGAKGESGARLYVKEKLDPALEKKVAETLDKILQVAEDPGKSLLAPSYLKKLLTLTKDAEVRFPSKEDEALKNLNTDLLDLIEDEPEFKALRVRMKAIFDILQINPEDYPRNSRKLEDMKADMRKLLLEEVSEEIGIGPCASVAEFQKKFRKLGTRGQIEALEKLNDSIGNNTSIEKVIRLFGRLTKSKYKAKGGGTPPAAPSAPSGAAPASPGPAPAAAPYVGPSGAPLPLEPMGIKPAETVSTAKSAPSESLILSEAAKAKATEAFMKKKGFEYDKNNPVLVAMRGLLISNIKKTEDLEALDTFLKSGEYSDEIDLRIKGKSKAEIKTEIGQVDAKLNSLNVRIRAEQRKYNKGYEAAEKRKDDLKDQHAKLAQQYKNQFGQLTPEQRRTMSNVDRQKMEALVAQMRDVGNEYQKLVQNPYHSTVNKLHLEKSDLENEKAELMEGLKRLSHKKGKETAHYRTPEQLLGMINLYFHKQKMGSDETPDFAKVALDTQEKIESARINQPNKLGWFINRISPASYIKPTLTATLLNVAEKDKSLSKITPEHIKELVKVWDDPGGVESWLRELEGSEKYKMEEVVPTLIGHLSVAVNAGGTSMLNAYSVNRGIKLLSLLRKASHEYALEQAEKQSGTSLQRMGAYFGQMNAINKKSGKVKENIVKNYMDKTIARRFFIPLGVAGGGVAIATGAAAIAAAGGIAVASTAAGGVGVGGAALSKKLKDPEQRALAKKVAVRGLVAGGLGALAVGAAPIVGIAALGAGVMSPEIWRNKGKIGKGGVKGAWKYGGVVLGLATLGFAFTNPRFNRFFGLPWNNK